MKEKRNNIHDCKYYDDFPVKWFLKHTMYYGYGQNQNSFSDNHIATIIMALIVAIKKKNVLIIKTVILIV